MDHDQAKSIKLAVEYLYDDVNGLALIEHLEDIAGKFAPNYDPSNSTSIVLAQGRTEMMQTLRNLNRLTVEQIVILSEGQEDE